MAQLLRYLILGIALLLYAGGCSRDVMHWFYQTGVITDDYRYGDLYRLSNLPQFKDPQEPCPPGTDQAQPVADSVHLYLIGDSFTEPQRIGQRDFPVGYYHYTHWEKQSRVQPDPTRHNVLLLETVERHFREHFSRPVSNLTVVTDSNRVPAPQPPAPSKLRQLSEQIKSTGLEERLETVLFSHDLFMWFKERKASLNFWFFDRINPKVGISADRQHVFAGLDTDTTTISSSFTPLPDAELNALVDSLNTVYDRYRALGFDAVYLSIIPNKASVLDPAQGNYNRLIERFQQHPKRRMPVIDIYGVYTRAKEPIYAVGDSHWNCTGRALWLREVHKRLTKTALTL
ncbi:hypothetical protein GCM10023189_35990 [Nibrella saemangeumensis]|uniref:SGNH hydrolase-like domain-containing protein, acetyltransferase AlgX n=1 Tax=Nibrella saemangeumensis TaxID=1084526 RepID=A0ABP8N765_9BACT